MAQCAAAQSHAHAVLLGRGFPVLAQQGRDCFFTEVILLRPQDDPDRAVRQGPGRGAARFLRIGRVPFAAGQQVARAQRAALHACQAGTPVAGAAAQLLRQAAATGYCQVGTAAFRRPQLQPVAHLQGGALPGGQGDVLAVGAQPFGGNRACQRQSHRAGLHPQFGAHATQFEHRFAALVAHQGVGRCCQAGVQPARLGDALVPVSTSSSVLDRGAEAGLQHFDHAGHVGSSACRKLSRGSAPLGISCCSRSYSSSDTAYQRTRSPAASMAG